MTEPRHGAERNRREETESGREVEFVTPEGQTVYRGAGCSVTRTVVEKWCSACRRWFTIKGILGHLFGCPDCGKEW